MDCSLVEVEVAASVQCCRQISPMIGAGNMLAPIVMIVSINFYFISVEILQ